MEEHLPLILWIYVCVSVLEFVKMAEHSFSRAFADAIQHVHKISKIAVVRLFSVLAHYELTLNPFCQHCSNKIFDIGDICNLPFKW